MTPNNHGAGQRRTLLAMLAVGASLPLFFISEAQFLAMGLPAPATLSRSLREIWNLSHLFYFAGIAALSVRIPGVRALGFGHWLAGMLAVGILLGGAIELLQQQTGRSGSLADFTKDIFGVLLVAALLCRRPFGVRHRQATLLRIMVAALLPWLLAPLAVALWDERQAAVQFPVLSDFETPFQDRRWDSGTISNRHSREGAHSLRVTLQPGQWSGPALEYGLGDWNGYRTLHLSLLNPSGTLGELHIKIRDRQNRATGSRYRDAFNRVVPLRRGWNDIEVAVEDIRNAPDHRPMDLSDLLALSLFVADLRHPELIYLDDIRLSR